MRRVLPAIFALSALSMTATITTAVAALDPSGTWMRGDGTARVLIAPCGPDVCATNIWIKDSSSSEAVGDKLVMKIKPKAYGLLTGTAFDAKRNLTYSMEMTVEKDRLKTRGCVISGMICKETDWSRVQ